MFPGNRDGRLAKAAREEYFMGPFHQMLPEDEIVLCGVVLLYGMIAGAVTRLVLAWRERMAA